MDKKHIIFLLSDQHNAAIVGFAGDKYVRTPNLDKLAASGVVFDNCYCNSPLCVPSRASMLSGLLPNQTGVYNNMQALPSDRVTFVHSISAAGYESVLSGRMHFIGPDQRHGFEKRLVGDVTRNYPGKSNPIYGDLKGTPDQNKKAIDLSGAGCSSVLLFDDDVANAAIKHIRERNDPRPLFMTVGFYGPHCPYVCPKELFDYYDSILPETDDLADFRRNVHPAIQKWYANRDVQNVTIKETKRVRAAYYGMVEYLDRLIGKIMEEITNTLGLENTIIIYGSDHGDSLGENGLFWKSNFYEGSARVPMIFNCPGQFPEGLRVNGLTSLLDVAPTFIDLSNGEKLPKMEGKSLLPVIQGKEEIDSQRSIIGQLADIKGDNPSAMLRKNNWKLILHDGYDYPQLFDLSKDPAEKQDLGQDQRYQEIIKLLTEELSRHWDAEAAIKSKDNFQVHLKILREWVKATNYQGVEEWQGDIEKNYLE